MTLNAVLNGVRHCLHAAKLPEANAVLLLPAHLELRLFTTGCCLCRANDEFAHSGVKALRDW